jgi:Fe-S cluster assembly iron-binding protein IscA
VEIERSKIRDEELLLLTVTENAATEIRSLALLPDAPVGVGMRISSDPAAGALTLSLAAAPAEDDAVVDADGARIFLDPAANAMLEDKTLDAITDSAGQVQFAVTAE